MTCVFAGYPSAMTTLTKLTGKLGAGLCAMAVFTALGAGTAAAAATAPDVSTGPVSATTGTTATVSGAVDPNGGATTWYVAYGTTTSYGSKTPAQSAGSGSTNVA